jgi:hypothetical protein
MSGGHSANLFLNWNAKSVVYAKALARIEGKILFCLNSSFIGMTIVANKKDWNDSRK